MGASNLATVKAPRNPHWRRVFEIADLVEIFDPDVQICVSERDMDSAIFDYLSGLESNWEFQAVETLAENTGPRLDGFPEGEGKSLLAADLRLLGEMVCELMDCAQVGLRIARISYAMCPGWHIDHTGIRLACTYQGPGTQWLNDQSVDRNDLQSEQIKNRAAAQSAPGEIVLLKGSLWQENEGFGAVHRSPDVPEAAGLRTVVTLDPLWDA